MRKIFAALLVVISMCSCAFAERLPTVTMLSTKTCPACRQMSKVLSELDEKYEGKISTEHIFLEERPELAKAYNVRYVPTLIFKDADGKIKSIEIGYRSCEDVIKIFEDNGVKI